MWSLPRMKALMLRSLLIAAQGVGTKGQVELADDAVDEVLGCLGVGESALLDECVRLLHQLAKLLEDFGRPDGGPGVHQLSPSMISSMTARAVVRGTET